MMPCYGMKVHKHFWLQILSINSSENHNRTINSRTSLNTQVEWRKGTTMQYGCNLYTLLRHKAGQEGRGEILLENSFMR